MVMARMQQRSDEAADWVAYDPVLAVGEMGYDQTAKRFKVGDGETVWTALPYADAAEVAEAAEVAAQAAAADAATAQAAAEAAAAAASAITGLTGEDDAVAFLLRDEESETYAAARDLLGLSEAVGALHGRLAKSVDRNVVTLTFGGAAVAAVGASGQASGYMARLAQLIQGPYPPRAEGQSFGSGYYDEYSLLFALPGVVAGWNTTQIANATAANYVGPDQIATVPVVNPSVIFHLIGDRDYALGTTPTTFRNGLDAAVAAIDAAAAEDPLHVFIAGPAMPGVTTPAYGWDQYAGALQGAAQALGSRGVYVDAWTPFVSAQASGPSAADPLNLITDVGGLTLTDAGHLLLANSVATALRFPPARVRTTPSLFDRFKRAPAQVLTSETGQLYEVHGTGTWSTDQNGLKMGTGTGGLVADTRSTTGVVVSAIVVPVSATAVGIVTKAASATTGVSLMLNGPTSQIQLRYGTTVIASAPYADGAVAGQTLLELVVAGAEVLATVNGRRVFTYTLSSGDAATIGPNTKHGVRALANNTSTVWSNLSIRNSGD